MKKILRSKINQRIIKSLKKLSLIFFFLVFVLGALEIKGTNSAFVDEAGISGNAFAAGYWIPVLSMEVSPAEPDGDSNFYKTHPCVTLSSSLSDTVIYYSFTNGSFTQNGVYSDTCILLPDGNWDFSAYGLYKDNPNWKSNIVIQNFKVDTAAPVVEITNPQSEDVLSGSIDIRGTVTDDNPHHYWLVVQNSSGTKVAGPGTVNDLISFTDKKLFTWNTAGVPDGTYRIKLEARDAAGNKNPDLSPVPNDPEIPTDSVDWITVTVNNAVATTGNVVLNEFLPNPPGGGSSEAGPKPGGEWVELYNNESFAVDVDGWHLYDDLDHDLPITSSNTDTGDTVISSHGWLVVYRDNDADFSLNNDGDTIKLYNGTRWIGTLLDSYTYPSTIEGKTYARSPDGTGAWVDPVPTPGKKNTESNDLEDFQKYYKKNCLDDGKLVCDVEFLESIGLFFDETTGKISEKITGNEAEKEETGEIVSKEVKIKFSRKPLADENLSLEIKQKIDEIKISGPKEDVEKMEGIIYDLEEIKIKSAGETTIKISDLDLPKEITVEGYDSKDVVMLIIAEEIILKKEVKIEFEGKLELSEGLVYEKEDVSQKIKEITVSGIKEDVEDLDEKITVDLSKLDKVKEEGEFHFRIEDLKLSKDINIIENEDRDVILEIKISNEDDDEEDEEDEDDKKEEDKILTEDKTE